MTSPNPFTDPGGFGAKGPRPRDMVGALVAYSPRIFTPAGAPGNEKGVDGGAPRDQVIADLIILEMPPGGAPILFGGSPEWEAKPTPHDMILHAAPAKFPSVYVSSQNIVRPLAPGGQPLVGQMVLGRIVRSDVGRRPFNLVSVSGTPDMEKAIQIWSQIQMGALPYVDPQPIPGMTPAVAPQPQVSYAAPSAPVVQYAPAPVSPAPQNDAFAAWQAQQAQAAVATSFPQAAALAPTGPPPPPGWTEAGWASLTPEQKTQVLGIVAR